MYHIGKRGRTDKRPSLFYSLTHFYISCNHGGATLRKPSRHLERMYKKRGF